MVQVPLNQPPSLWRPPSLSTLPSWGGAKRVAIDIETHDPELTKTGIGVRREGKMVGVSFAIEDGPSAYLPFGHEGGDNLAKEDVLRYLRDQARDFKGELVGANLSYDLDYLAESDITFTPRAFRDVLVIEPILDELHYSFGLGAVAEYNGMPGKSEDALREAAERFKLDPKKDLWRLPARFVGPYAERDATLPLAILRNQESRLAEQDSRDPRQPGLANIWALESRLLPILLAMRRRGVRIDFDQLDRVEARSIREEEDNLAEMSRLSGSKVTRGDINKVVYIAKIIEAATGFKMPKTAKTGQPSIKKSVLAPIKDHPVVSAYLRAKRYNKLRTTFVKSIRAHQVKGRVHCTFNQLKRESDDGGDDDGTISGRISSTDPNLQQQPGRDPEIGPMWRSIYLPEVGRYWCSADFSQQEPRWLVHFAEGAGCRGARIAADKYRADPKIDNHTMMAAMLRWEGKEGRDRAKAILLGLSYNMGGAKLCREIGKPTKWIETRNGRMIEVAGEEGQEILNEFDSRLPFIRELSQRAEESAKKHGYTRTVLGRRCRYPKPLDGRPGWMDTEVAGNRLMQGSSADQTKKAMIDADDAGIDMTLQVHDEICRSSGGPDEDTHLAEIMEGAVACNIPHRVKCKTGINWGVAA